MMSECAENEIQGGEEEERVKERDGERVTETG
jgi:hypothetical protein